MNNVLKLLFCTTSLLVQNTAFADNVTFFSFSDGSLQETWWGTGLKENYDVAVKITAPNFVGTEIVGIRITVPDTDDISTYSAWLSSELKLENKQNVADITSKEGQRDGDTLEIMFDSPYTLTADGVYAGYSFHVDNGKEYAGKNPLCVVNTSNPDGLYIHSSRSYLQWMSISESKGVCAAFQVLIKGDFANNSLMAQAISEVNTIAGSQATSRITVVNSGVNSIESIGYTLTVGETIVSENLELDTPVAGQIGAVSNFDIAMPIMHQKGVYPIQFTITQVNGVDNNETMNSTTSEYFALDYLPKHNPVLEEYTGTWCSWCPIGFVGLELMSEKHPDFIGIAYHCGDVMSMHSNIPDPEVGYPMANLDRVELCSPYYGPDDSNTFGIESLWQSYVDTFTPFDIAVKADFTDDTRQEVKIDAQVTSVKSIAGKDYRVEYVLIEDGLTGTGTSWSQSNSYSGDESYRGLEGMDFFIDNNYQVKGLEFNDVAILNTGNLGVEGSLPAEIEADKTYSTSHTFALTDAINTAKAELVQDKDRLRVVVMVVENDGSQFGKIINAAKCGLVSSAGIIDVMDADTSASVLYTRWYDLQGHEVSNPVHGFYIKVDLISNGNLRSTKLRL